MSRAAATHKLLKATPTVAPTTNEPENLPRYVWLRAVQDALTTEIEKLCEVTVPPNVVVNIGAGLKSVKRLRIDADTVITTNEVQVYHQDQTRTVDDKKGTFEIFIAPTVDDPARIGQLMLRGLLEVTASKDTMHAKEKTPYRLEFIDVDNERDYDNDMKRWTKLFGMKRVEHAEGKHIVYEPSKKTREIIDAAIKKAGGYEHARLVVKDPAKKKENGTGAKKGDVNRQVKICCPHHQNKVHMKGETGELLFKTQKDERGHPKQVPVMGEECGLAFRASREKYNRFFGPDGLSPIICKIHGKQVIIDEVDIEAIEAANKSGKQMVAEKSRSALTGQNARVRRSGNRKSDPASPAPAPDPAPAPAETAKTDDGEGNKEPQQPPFPGNDATAGQEHQTVPLAATTATT